MDVAAENYNDVCKEINVRIEIAKFETDEMIRR
jgi:hypothetical protein